MTVAYNCDELVEHLWSYIGVDVDVGILGRYSFRFRVFGPGRVFSALQGSEIFRTIAILDKKNIRFLVNLPEFVTNTKGYSNRGQLCRNVRQKIMKMVVCH